MPRSHLADQPAFPFAGDDIRDAPEFEANGLIGLTKREFFAAMAMHGALANANTRLGHGDPTFESLALFAAKQADAMLIALEKGGG